jgi:glycine amidinotransferase
LAFPEHGYPLGTFGSLPEEMEAKACELLDNFAAILVKRGIRVDRPAPLDFSQAIQTPDWQQGSMFGCMPPRDVLLTVGNEILEAPMSFRSRWFEYLCYRPMLEQYYREDKNFRWETAPKPRLTERSYKKDFWREWHGASEAEQWKRTQSSDWEIVMAPKSVRREKMPLCTCSLWLNMNCLVIDPKTVCVEAAETPMMELLDKYGFEVIPVPLFEVSPFGGGLHCATADVYREGSLEDYFPKQIEGF